MRIHVKKVGRQRNHSRGDDGKWSEADCEGDDERLGDSIADESDEEDELHLLRRPSSEISLARRLSNGYLSFGAGGRGTSESRPGPGYSAPRGRQGGGATIGDIRGRRRGEGGWRAS